MHTDILIRAHLAHAQKNKYNFCHGPKIGEGGDDKQVINLIWPKQQKANIFNHFE